MSSLEPGQQWSDFRLLEKINDGCAHTNAEAWLAKLADDSRDGATQNTSASGSMSRYAGTTFVLKILGAMPPNLLATRLAEWRALQIPNVMVLLGVHSHGDRMALALPYVKGDSAMMRGAPHEEWSRWLQQVIAAVGQMHEEDFVHGDLKLANIRRDEDGTVLIGDPWLPGDGKSRFTASPERLAGGKISKQDDAYAIGVLMHELMTGYPPDSDPSTIAPRSPTPVEMVELALTLLSPDPARRATLQEAGESCAKLSGGASRVQRAASRAQTAKSSPPPTVATNREPPALTRSPPPTAIGSAPRRDANSPRAALPPPLRPLSAVAAMAAERNTKVERVAQPAVQRVAQRVVGLDRAAVTRPVYADEPQPVLSEPMLAEPVTPVPVARMVAEPQSFTAEAAAVSHAETRDVPIYASPSLAAKSPFGKSPSRPIGLLLILAAGCVGAYVWLPPETTERARAFVQPYLDRIQGIAETEATGSTPTQPTPAAVSSAAEASADSTRAAGVSTANNPSTPADLRQPPGDQRAAEQMRDQAEQLERTLRAEGAAARPLPAFIAASQARVDGLSHLDNHEALAAQEAFARALTGFAAVRDSLPHLHEQALNAGETALAQCLPDAAGAEFRYALALFPQDATARAGIQSAQVCEQVIRHIAAGQRLEQAGDSGGALAEYQQAQKLDPNSVAARDAANGIIDHFADDRVGGLRSKATEGERSERWGEALKAYQQILAIDPSLGYARTGAQHAQGRLAIDQELQSYLDHPRRLGDDEVRASATAAVQRIQDMGSRGHHLQNQIDRLTALLAQADEPVDVLIDSDALTEVIIDGKSDLGPFGTKRVALKPGTYTLIGKRRGYSDVRVQLEVTPGEQDASVNVRCVDRI